MQHPSYKQQSGLVMIVLLTIIMVGGLAWLLQGLNRNQYDLARQTQTIEALADAKEALIAFAVTYPDHDEGDKAGFYGFLPCPDTNDGMNDEGDQDVSCGSQDENSLGRLPWKTLGIAPLRDGDGECLWYAVSGSYKNWIRTDLLNEDRAGRFIVREANNTATADRIIGRSGTDKYPERPVALIIAPGKVLTAQDRTPDGSASICGGNYSAANYLDIDNASSGGSGINNAELGTGTDVGEIENAIMSSFPRNDSVNDVIAYVTQADIFDAVRRRAEFQQNLQCLTQIAAQCLAKYGRDNGRLPWAGTVALPDYTANASYVDDASITHLGRLPNTLTNSNTQLSISSPAFLLSNGSDFLCDVSSLDSTTLSQCTAPSTLTPSELAMCDGQSTTTACQNKKNEAVTAARRLWEHWKDHFFYAVSADFTPTGTPTTECTNCVTVNEIKYAGFVLLAGKAAEITEITEITLIQLQHRNMSPDIETVNALKQYVDLDDSLDINNTGDDDAYTYLADSVRTEYDDFIVCIGTDLAATSVNPCTIP